MTNSIDPNLFLSSSYQKREVKTGNDVLGKDDFLKLLMVQLQNQDPMNPMQDKEFIAQMATFSSLEQMTNMNQAIEKLVQAETQSSLISYSKFVGKEVTWHMVNEGGNSEQPNILEGKGVIQSVQFVGDTVKFFTEDGLELSPANISQVHDSTYETPLIRASALIGKNVSWLDGKETVNAIIQSVSQQNGKIMLQTENGDSISTNQITKIG
ncbi:flagellar hook assembly protein FlgD [Lederbergia graminis]|uniref:Basal-body rod modification protein FlgD n=1 Tax=Lederbergia graminis TaxID=735518 RepID=A0ABW0LFV3_9BACI|nr:flagellar hook assembly protein FlgD [Paenibacillus bovis]HLU21900.1 flagellar hook assembly protein FlgD [Bacillaceae bacterium]